MERLIVNQQVDFFFPLCPWSKTEEIPSYGAGTIHAK